MKLFSLTLFLLTTGICSAQLTDNFSDGNISSNPSWNGDTADFIVNGSQQLQLNAPAAGNSYLVTSGNATSLDSTEWQFYIHLNFAPSSGNYSRVYLVSDQQNLQSALNGYYLQFGEGGTNDAIELFRQTGTTSTTVARGTNAFIAAAFTITVKITRDSAGLWSIYADPAAGTNFILQATGTDTTHNSSAWFGVACTYTITNSANFFFDDFIWPYVPDIIAPTLFSATPLSSTQLDVKFSESVEQTSAETLSNYFVDNGIGNPSSASRDISDNSLVHLIFSTSFVSPTTYIVTVDSVQDLNNNMLTQDTASFLYFIPAAYDIIINEIMADFDPPVSLPSHEYVELFNRSNYSINLNGWTFSDAGSPQTIGNVTMPAGSYLILCSTTAQSQFVSYGAVHGISGFPSLNNTGGEPLTLRNQSGILIDSVYYDETFYHDTNKDDGGWSIERIAAIPVCANETNWHASLDTSGGTPGAVNSVIGIADSIPPQVLQVCVTDSTHLQVFFSEPMDAVTISDVLNYSSGFISATPASDNKSVTLLRTTLQSNIVYTLFFSAAISDCGGNSIGTNVTAKYVRTVSPTVSDVMLNEVLFNSRTSNSSGEFVELYNRSDKIISLSDLKITRRDLTTLILDAPVSLTSRCDILLFPGDYLVLTDSHEAVHQYYSTPNSNAFLEINLPDLLTDEDIIVLQDAAGNILDELHYYSSWHFPLLTTDDGVSLERINPDKSTQDSTNWHSAAESAGFATPGYRNSQYSESSGDGSEISVSPEIFSPDNDGHNDVVNFNYHFDETGYVANVTIFDSRGRHVRKLASNELLGTTGSFTWDGVNDKREKSSIGIYIVFVEVFKLDGAVKSFKKTCVLASRL